MMERVPRYGIDREADGFGCVVYELQDIKKFPQADK
jgi:hypothetical protein